MQRAGLSIVIVVALAGTAAAQNPAPGEPVSAGFLENRVSEELVGQGSALSRRNLVLHVTQAGEQWTAALVDASNGQVAASTTVGRLPDDPDAAVTAMTQAVVALDAQVDRRVNEFKFQLLSVRFAPTYLANARLDRGARQWQLYRGGRTQRLDAPEFYQMVGRDDLVAAYERRRHIMIGAYIASGVAFGAAAVLTYLNETDLSPCSAVVGPNGQTCVNNQQRSLVPIIIALGVGLVGVGVGTYFQRTPQPIGEDDAKALADAYNQKLRGQLRLSEVASASPLRDVVLVPYAGSSTSAGLALAARF